MGKTANYIVVGLVLLALLGCGYFGYTMYPRLNKCPDIVADTLYLPDTTTHTIPDKPPEYVTIRDSIKYRDPVWMDSVIKANKVDTAEILKDYYAIHYHTRNWFGLDSLTGDSLLTVTIKDQVSRNTFIDNIFTYKILRNQQVINNVINNTSYANYILVGAGTNMHAFKGVDLDATLVTKRYYLGVGYDAYANSISFRLGLPIVRW